MKNFINHIFQIQFQQFLRLSFMVTCQSSELDWEVTVELPTDFLSLGRGSVMESYKRCSFLSEIELRFFGGGERDMPLPKKIILE